MDVKWTRKDLLSIYDLSAEEITLILDTAAEFKKVSQRKIKKVPALRGKTVVNLFVEPSTRTRTSFELANTRSSVGHHQYCGGFQQSPQGGDAAGHREKISRLFRWI